MALAPVAVGSAHQRRGTGQELIRYGLDLLRERAVAVVVTYGDPGYYCNTGFPPISTTTSQPPLPLSMPHGWLGQSLTGNPLPVIGEQTRCVSEFNDPVYW